MDTATPLTTQNVDAKANTNPAADSDGNGSGNGTPPSAEDFAKQQQKETEAHKNREGLSKELEKYSQAAAKAKNEYPDQLRKINEGKKKSDEYWPGDWKLKKGKLCKCDEAKFEGPKNKYDTDVKNLESTIDTWKNSIPGLEQTYNSKKKAYDEAKKKIEELTNYASTLLQNQKDLQGLQGEIDARDDKDALSQMWYLLAEYKAIYEKCKSNHSSNSLCIGLGNVWPESTYIANMTNAWNTLYKCAEAVQVAWKSLNDTKIDLEHATKQYEEKKKKRRENILAKLEGVKCEPKPNEQVKHQ